MMSPKRIAFVLFLFCLCVRAQTVETITGPFNASGGVAVNQVGEVFVADFGILLNNANGTQVFKVLSDGTVSVFATGLGGASGNDFDSQGNLFQSNIAAGSVSRIAPDGTVTPFASQFIVGPVGVAIDEGDNVFVANCGGGNIARVTPAGASSIFATSPLLSCPNGLTIDSDGNLYTANFNNGAVLKIDPAGTVTSLVVVPGNGNGHLTFANGVLYVVGRNANQIFEVTLQGTVTRIAGAGSTDGFGPRGNADGPALQATFSIPNGIRASPDGDTLYINSAVGTVGGNLNPVVLRAIRGVRGLMPTLHFAQFGNGDGFNSDLVLSNASATVTVEGDVDFRDGEGNPIAVSSLLDASAQAVPVQTAASFQLPPLGTVTFSTSGQGTLITGSALVKSTGTVSGVIRFNIPGIGIAGVGASSPARAVLAPVRRAGALRTGVAIRNVEDAPVQVDLTLKDSRGVQVSGGNRQMQIPAQGRTAAFIEELFPTADTSSFTGTICIRGLDGQVAVIALELGDQPGQFTTLPVTPIEN